MIQLFLHLPQVTKEGREKEEKLHIPANYKLMKYETFLKNSFFHFFLPSTTTQFEGILILICERVYAETLKNFTPNVLVFSLSQIPYLQTRRQKEERKRVGRNKWAT